MDSLSGDAGTNFGIMNVVSRRLGANQSPAMEMLMVLVVPMVLRILGELSPWELLKKIWKFIFGRKPKDYHFRFVKTVLSGSSYVSDVDAKEQLDIQNKNAILQKAIRMYLQAKYNNDTTVQEVFLAPMRKVALEVTQTRYGGQTEAFTGSATQLASYEVTMLPTENNEFQLNQEHEDELTFKQYIQEQAEGNESKKPYKAELVYEIRSCGPGAKERVDAWIQDAFAWYRDTRKAESKSERFMIQATDEPAEDQSSSIYGNERQKIKSSAGISYKQYLLSDEKTFDSLFFAEKEALLSLLEDFLKRRGKFQVPGFPKKLGLLLDGPPGSGKTSLIKALAAYTRRHIVSISLEKITTNQQLMDIMFELTFPVKSHEEGGFKLKMDEIVFVMEDVDCASKVVFARKGAHRFRAAGQMGARTMASPNTADSQISRDIAPIAPKHTPTLARSRSVPVHGSSSPSSRPVGALEQITLKPQAVGTVYEAASPTWTSEARKLCVAAQVPYKALEPLFLEWAEENGVVNFEELAGLLQEKHGDLPLKEMEKRRVIREASALVKVDPSPSPADNVSEEDAAGSSEEESENREKKRSKKSKAEKQSFTLAGLLNVLDGVVDSPGRILVMTTNQPEKLDPALIRPGRINQRLHMGYMGTDQLKQMAEHYLQQAMTASQQQKLQAILHDRDVTPAWVEQCCVESHTMDDLLRILSH